MLLYHALETVEIISETQLCGKMFFFLFFVFYSDLEEIPELKSSSAMEVNLLVNYFHQNLPKNFAENSIYFFLLTVKYIHWFVLVDKIMLS